MEGGPDGCGSGGGLRNRYCRLNFVTVAVGGGQRLRIVAGRLGQADEGAGDCDDLAVRVAPHTRPPIRIGRNGICANGSHFASMRSSQALTQSVFGSLAALGKVGALAGLTTDDGLPTVRSGVTVRTEYLVEHLGEPRSTSVDVWLDDGEQRVAVECKFTEREFGRCSRPTLRPGRNPNYERAHCDGSYTRQRGRRTRCSLTEIGV